MSEYKRKFQKRGQVIDYLPNPTRDVVLIWIIVCVIRWLLTISAEIFIIEMFCVRCWCLTWKLVSLVNLGFLFIICQFRYLSFSVGIPGLAAERSRKKQWFLRDLCLDKNSPMKGVITIHSTPNLCAPSMRTHVHIQSEQMLEKAGWWTHQPIPQ